MRRPIPKRGFELAHWMEALWLDDARWVVRHYWKRIGLLTLLGLGASTAYLHWNPDTYVSRAEVRFIPPQLADRYVVPNVAMQVEQRVFALAQLVGSRLTATKMIERFGLYPERRRFLPVADLVAKFQEDLQIRKVVNETSSENKTTVPTMVITFHYAHPEIAQKVVQRIVELVYEENRRYRGDQSLGTTEFLQQQVKTVLEQLGEVEERLAGLEDPTENDHNYRGVIKTGQLHDLARRHTDLQHQLNTTIVERDLRRSLLGALEAQLETLNQRRDSDTPATTWALETQRSLVTTIRARAEEMKLRYAPGFPERTLAENALRAAEDGLKSLERNETRAQMDTRREELQNQMGRVRAEWRAYELTVKRMEKDERELAAQVATLRTRYLPDGSGEMDRIVIQREYSMLKDHYAELLKKQRESQIASDMERRGQGETVELIEPASAPRFPEMPNWPIKLALGGLAGLILGYSWSLESYLKHPRIRTADHIALLGDFPVLAQLPRATPLLSAARSKGAVRAGATVALLLFLAACQRDTAATLTKRAQESLKQGDGATALILLRKAIQLDARYPEAHYELAILQLKEGAAALARESLIRAAEAWPNRKDVQIKLGDLSYEIYFSDPGRPAALLREVEETAQRLAQRWPDDPAGHRLLAQVLIERNQPAEAVALMEKAIGQLKDPSSDGAAALKSQLGSTLYQMGNQTDGEAQLRDLLRDHPKYTPGYDLLYLQLMDRRQLAAARAVLEEKYTHLPTIAFGLQVAAHDFASGEHAKAAAAAEQLAQHHGGAPLAFSDLGDFWVHRGDVDRARRFYELGQQKDSTNRPVYAGRIAELLAAKQGTAAARQYLSRELARSPNDPLLMAYSSAMDLDAPSTASRNEARTRLESILSKMPNSPFVRFHLGRAYLRAGELERAGQNFEKCVMLDPNYAPGWVALAEADLLSGRVGLAQNRIRALLQRSPTFTPALLMQAKANLAGQKPGDAETGLAQVVAQDPSNIEAWMTLARAQIGQNKLAEAQKSAAAAVAAAKSNAPQDFRPRLLAAELDAMRGDAPSALRSLEQATREWPDQEVVAEAQANLTLRHGEPEAARGLYAKLLERQSGNDGYRLGLAGALALLGRSGEAATQFERLQKSKPDDPRPWLLHGALLSARGRLPEARKAYEEALRRDRNHPMVLNNLAFVIAKSGKDLPSALQYAEQAKRVLPASREVNDTLAYVYVAMGMDRNAIAILEEMSAARPQDLKVARLLAQVRQGNRPAALKQFEVN